MASCKLCTSLVGSTKLQYDDALAEEHAQLHFRQLCIIDEGITFDQILDRCFMKNVKAETRSYTKSSKYRSLVQLCRTLFSKITPSKSRRFLCKKCNSEKTIYATDGKCLVPSKLIDHACSHLRLDFYECRKCARQFSTRYAINVHLAQSHRLESTAAHFVARLDDFVNEISIMIKECFSKEKAGSDISSLRATRVFTGVKVSELCAKRQTLCYHLVKKFGDETGNVQCRLCVKGIKATTKDGCTSRNLMNHAFRHLQKPTARCKVCSKGFWNLWILEPHLQNVHGLPLANNYENIEDQFHDDIMAVLRKCYSDNADKGATEETRRNSIIKPEISIECTTARGSPLTIERRMVCYGLCRKFIDRNGKMKCKVCGKRMKARNAAGVLTSANVMRHALTHLSETGLNRCKICSKTFLTQTNMLQHLRVTHALPLANNYECLADQYHQEILDILHKCFGDETNDEAPSGGTSESRIRNHVKGSELAIERQSRCVQLIKKYLDRDGKMACRMCSKRITATKASGCYKTVEVTYHALTHTRIHLYRCKLCRKSFGTRQRVMCHLNHTHETSGDESKYECLEDQYHSEIVDMFRQCYGDEMGSTK